MDKDTLQIITTVITGLSGIISIAIAVVGFCYAYKEYCKTKRDNVRSKLAKEAYALYFVEKQAMKKIAANNNITEQTAQRQLREDAVKDVDNVLAARPSQNANYFLQYI